MKAIIMAILMALSATAAADQCKMTGDIAEMMMKARQVGVPMQEMMAVSQDNELRAAMVLDAYEVPRFTTEKFQKRQEQDFRDKWYMACYKALKDS